MRIGFDARTVTHPQLGGFKTYSTHLCRALATVTPDDDLFLYTDREAIEGQLPAGPRVHVRVVRAPLPVIGAALREQWSLPRAVRGDRLDVFHAPALTAPLASVGCPLVLTLHDMLWLRWPAQGGLRRQANAWYFRTIPRHAARRAHVIIAVSEATRRDVIADLGLPPERIVVVPEAPGPGFGPGAPDAVVERLRARWGLAGPFVLALGGSSDPRKNVPLLLESMALLRQRGATPRLVVVWASAAPAPQVAAHVQRLGLAADVADVIRPDDDGLADLYRGCAVFAFPSRNEGFGLPILEAMACGAPVVAANTSSLPEVVGEAGMLVPPEDARALADALAAVLSDADLRERLSSSGRAWAARFSWERAARQTLEVYRSASVGRAAQSLM